LNYFDDLDADGVVVDDDDDCVDYYDFV